MPPVYQDQGPHEAIEAWIQASIVAIVGWPEDRRRDDARWRCESQSETDEIQLWALLIKQTMIHIIISPYYTTYVEKGGVCSACSC